MRNGNVGRDDISGLAFLDFVIHFLEFSNKTQKTTVNCGVQVENSKTRTLAEKAL